jgi:glutathione peroxidase
MSRPTAYAFTFAGLDGATLALAEHAGRPILIVNTASQCGYTPQLAGGPAEIDKTAHGEYGVSFPLAAKAAVKGPSAHPFYKWAALERPGEAPRWNFHKYLIGRDGRIAAVFSTQIEPTEVRVIAAIEKELL